MSLKAKIEAVIYASEEPVTLAQLVGLLGEEAQAELDREAAAQLTLLQDAEAEAVADEEPKLGADFDASETAEEAAPESSESATPAAEQPADEPSAQHPAGPVAEAAAVEPESGGEAENSAAAGAETADTSAADAAAAARAEKARMARLRQHFRGVLDKLIAEYAAPESDRGLEIREVGGGFRMATKPEYHDAVRGFVKSLKPPLKLSLQALETLAVVAYKQPVTAPEISEIRGVDSAGVLGSLITRKLITTAGRKQVIGRPILYKTTKEFLLKFGLKDVAELPSIEEFEKMAGQMAEQEEMAMEHEKPEPTDTVEHEKPEPTETVEAAESTEPVEASETAESTEERLESDQEAPEPEPVADEVVVDGRMSGLPPRYDNDADDPSAQEAEIQEEERG